jgi:lysophospholipase L1-like esterase
LAYCLSFGDAHYYAAANKELAGRQVEVIFLGDSITSGWSNPERSHFIPDHQGFVNRGIPGDHVLQMIFRMPSDVFALRPRTVVLLGGINDLGTSRIPDKLRFLMPLEVESSIYIIANRARAHREHLILCSITPVSDKKSLVTVKHRRDQILAVNAWIEAFAQKRGLAYVDFYSVLSDGHNRMQDNFTEDGLHPNSRGYAAIEPLIERAIEAENTISRDVRTHD